MCGILGFIGPRDFSAEQFAGALRSLAHRGPDGEGIYEEPEALLGHRRLSILDLSDADRQPMPSSSGRQVIVYNGEVYNHDPFIPVAPKMRSWPHLPRMESQPLTSALLEATDAAVLVTDHRSVDYNLVAEQSPVVIDTRGVFHREGGGVVHA